MYDDPTTAQPTPAQPQPVGQPFVVGRSSAAPLDPDATAAYSPEAEWAAPAVPAAAPARRRRGKGAAIALGIVGALAIGAVGAGALSGEDQVVDASGRPIGSDLAGALPEGESAAAPLPPVTEAPATPTTPAPTTPAPTTPPTDPTPSTPTPPPVELPSVDSVSAPSSVICSDGVTKSITISWVVEHADEVVVSIDGPGAYQSYPGTNGSDSVPFACDGAQHTYMVSAKADGHTASKTVVVSPLYLDPMPELVVEVPGELPMPGGD